MLSRRTVFGLAAGAAAAAGVCRAQAADKVLPGKVELYCRARGAPPGARGMIWYTGTLWGKRTLDAAVPLFHVDGFSFNRLEMQADGGAQQNMIEVGFWCDPLTGKPADKWINPLNGLACEPNHYKSSQSIRFDGNGHGVRAEKTPEGMTYEAVINEPIVSGETVWIGESIVAKRIVPAVKANDPLEIGPSVNAQTSLVNYTLHRKEIATPTSTWLPATMNYQTMGGWYPWMRMGQESGQIMFQLVGRKIRRTDEIPPALRRLIDERHAGWLKDPGV